MSDNDSESTEAPVSPNVSAGVSPILRNLSMSEQHAELDDHNDADSAEPRKMSTNPTASRPMPAAASFSNSASEDALRQAHQVQEYLRQTAVANPNTYPSKTSASPPSVPSSDATATSAVSVSAQPAGSKAAIALTVINEQAATIVQTIGEAFNDKTPRTALPFPKHSINLPAGFISVASLVVEVLRARKSKVDSHKGKDFSALLKQAVLLLNNNDTTRLEAAMLTLHSLHLAAASTLGSNIAAWGEQFMLWSEENRVLVREALDLFETMCEPSCKPLTLWYFQHALSSQPMLPFSALLGRYTPAHVRNSPANLATVLTALKAHGKPMSCKEFQRQAKKIPKPSAKRVRPSVAKTSKLTQKVLKESKKVARCVAVVAETMGSADQDVFTGMIDTLSDEASLDKAVAFLDYPMQKRYRAN